MDMDQVQRRLTYEMHAIFTKVQSVVKLADENSLGTEETMLFSNLYCSAIKKSIDYLTSDIDYSQQHETLNDLLSGHIIWVLFEIVTIRPKENALSLDLMDWGRQCVFPTVGMELKDMIEDWKSYNADYKYELHPNYWKVVLEQTVRGDFASAALLIKQHSKYKEGDVDYHRLASSLDQIELALSRNRVSCDEFVRIQKNLSPFRAAAPTSCHDLKFIYSILLGETCTFIECAKVLNMKWFQLFPTYVLFSCPLITDSDLGKLAKQFYNEVATKTGFSAANNFDDILFAILNFEYLEALNLICSAGEKAWWLCLHLIDLISKHDSSAFTISTKNRENNSDLDLRYRLLVKYSEMLFDKKDMWEIAIDYAIHSGMPDTLKFIEKKLKNNELWSPSVAIAEEIISVCQRYGFHDAKAFIINSVTNFHLTVNEWSSALCWSLRGGNRELVSKVARRILNYAHVDDITQMHIFQSMSDKFLIAPELIVLFKFYKYQKLIRDGNLVEATKVLNELFQCNAIPNRFYLIIMQQTTRHFQSFVDNIANDDNEDDDVNIYLNSDDFRSMLLELAKFETHYESRLKGYKNAQIMNLDEDIRREMVKMHALLPKLVADSFFFDQVY